MTYLAHRISEYNQSELILQYDVLNTISTRSSQMLDSDPHGLDVHEVAAIIPPMLHDLEANNFL